MGAYRYDRYTNSRVWDETVDTAPDGTLVPARAPIKEPSAGQDAVNIAANYGMTEGMNFLVGGGSQAASAASQAAFNAGAGASSQAAFNAGADAASGISGVGTSAASSGTPAFSMGTPSYAGYAAAAMDLYNGYRNYQNAPERMRGTKAQQGLALAAADVWTGGMAGMAEGFARKHWGGTMSKLDKLDQKTNPVSILINKFGTSKSNGQLARDASRKTLKETGVIDDKYQIHLADGSVFDMGKDGGARLKNSDGTERNYHEIDSNDPRFKDQMGDIVALISPLGYAATIGVNGKKFETKDKDVASSQTGYLVNAVTQNAKTYDDVVNNAKGVAKQMGLTQSNYHALLDNLKTAGRIDDEAYKIYEAKLGMIAAPDEEAAPAPVQNSAPRDNYVPTPEAPEPKKKKVKYTPYQYGPAPGTTSQPAINDYVDMLARMHAAGKV